MTEDSYYIDSIAEFKSLIKYDETRPLSPGWVVMRWLDELCPLTTDARRAIPSTEATILPDGTTEWNCVLKEGDTQFEIEIWWNQQGAKKAENEMLFEAVNTTMVMPAYVRGPQIGDRCLIITSGTGVQTIVWCYANVHARIQTRDAQNDVLPIAHELQALMERHIFQTTSSFTPLVEIVNCSTHQPKKGETFTVDIRLGARNRARAEGFEVQCNDEYVAYVSTEKLGSLKFEAVTPGKTEILVYIADRDTLVSTRVVIPIDIQPKKAP